MIDIKNKTADKAKMLNETKKLTAEGYKRRYLKSLKAYRMNLGTGIEEDEELVSQKATTEKKSVFDNRNLTKCRFVSA